MRKKFAFYGEQAIIYSQRLSEKKSAEVINAEVFKAVARKHLSNLRSHKSILLSVFPPGLGKKEQEALMFELLSKLSGMPGDEIKKKSPELRGFFDDTYMLDQFVESLYNFWRSYERYLVCYSSDNGMLPTYKKPFRTFNRTIEHLNDQVRKAYRDIRENITGEHPNIYRQVSAGCHVGIIAAKKSWPCPPAYKTTKKVPFIRQVLMEPPLIIDPPMNRRQGQFQKVMSNPLAGIDLSSDEWLCYPAKVCDTLIHIYFHQKFIGLGASIANIFDLATDDELGKKPDAIYAYGAPIEKLKRFGSRPTVFFDDEKNGIVVAAVPGDDEYGYFGYIKKMVLTLHNVVAMKRGRLPVHGAMVRITLKSGKSANVIIWGDTGAGKSESIEAFRVLSGQYIRDMSVIFDDMGTLEISPDGTVKAYGTETGAFVRLDDLKPGFAFGNLDRAIIMSPQKINARAAIPITTIEEVTAGYQVDFFLYDNNYEKVSKARPILERLSSVDGSMRIFREAKRIAKGTTAEKGIVTSYFANIFGPLQYRGIYEELAKKVFSVLFDSGVMVGQLRTMLGIPGFETRGPENAARALFRIISES